MSKTRLAQLAVAAVAAPALLLGFSGAAQAAEVTPVAEYVDSTVADTEAELGAILDAAGLEAE